MGNQITSGMAIVTHDGEQLSWLSCEASFQHAFFRQAVDECQGLALADPLMPAITAPLVDAVERSRAVDGVVSVLVPTTNRGGDWLVTVAPVKDNLAVPPRWLLTACQQPGCVSEPCHESADLARQEAIIASLYEGVICLDSNQRISVFNPAAEAIFGYCRDEVIGQSINMLIPERFHQQHELLLANFVQSDIQSKAMGSRNQVKGRRKDGEEFPVDVSISKAVHGDHTEMIAIVRDNSEQLRQLEELKQRALTDALTGLKNRDYFRQQAVQFVAEARRYQKVFSLLVIDIDHFKKINDNHGHAMGDQVLVSFAKEISPLLRDVDILVRYGGEEFVVLLPFTDLSGATQLAERLRSHVADSEVAYIPYTLSIGVTEFDVANDDIDKVFQRADKALYRAKKKGRNRVESG